MKATELRIGNYVNVPNKNQCPFRIDGFEYLKNDCGKVEMQTIQNTHPLTWEISDITPIPLAHELYKKCGFKKTEEGYESIINGFRICLSYGKYLTWCPDDDNFYLSIDYCYGIGIPIIYLHQLQNLVFILTGEELNVEQLLNQ